MRLSLGKTERKLHRLSDKLGSFAALTAAYCLTAAVALPPPPPRRTGRFFTKETLAIT